MKFSLTFKTFIEKIAPSFFSALPFFPFCMEEKDTIETVDELQTVLDSKMGKNFFPEVALIAALSHEGIHNIVGEILFLLTPYLNDFATLFTISSNLQNQETHSKHLSGKILEILQSNKALIIPILSVILHAGSFTNTFEHSHNIEHLLLHTSAIASAISLIISKAISLEEHQTVIRQKLLENGLIDNKTETSAVTIDWNQIIHTAEMQEFFTALENTQKKKKMYTIVPGLKMAIEKLEFTEKTEFTNDEKIALLREILNIVGKKSVPPTGFKKWFFSIFSPNRVGSHAGRAMTETLDILTNVGGSAEDKKLGKKGTLLIQQMKENLKKTYEQAFLKKKKEYIKTNGNLWTPGIEAFIRSTVLKDLGITLEDVQ